MQHFPGAAPMKVEITPVRVVQAVAALFLNGQEEKPLSINDIARDLLIQEGAYDPALDKRLLLAALRLIHRRPWPFKISPVICFVGKGGANKSTATTQFAVIAAKKGLRVLVLDSDRQRSVSTWSAARGNDPSITVRACEYNRIEATCREGKKAGFNLILVDHPQQPGEAWPALVRSVDQFVLLARPALFDLKTAQQWIRHLEAHKAPYLAVISSAPPRREMIDNPAVRDARSSLQALTSRLWPGQITARQPIVTATASGRGIIEFEPAGPASVEYMVLWHRVLQTMKRGMS
jgi:chromosome partitioning protein